MDSVPSLRATLHSLTSMSSPLQSPVLQWPSSARASSSDPLPLRLGSIRPWSRWGFTRWPREPKRAFLRPQCFQHHQHFTRSSLEKKKKTGISSGRKKKKAQICLHSLSPMKTPKTDFSNKNKTCLPPPKKLHQPWGGLIVPTKEDIIRVEVSVENCSGEDTELRRSSSSCVQ